MKNQFISLNLICMLIGCSPRAAVEKTQAINFSQYHTCAWMESGVKAGQSPLYYNQLATQCVEQTVNQVLRQRGLDSTSRNLDVPVGYHFFVEDKTRLVAYNLAPTPVMGLTMPGIAEDIETGGLRGGAGTPGGQCIPRKIRSGDHCDRYS